MTLQHKVEVSTESKSMPSIIDKRRVQQQFDRSAVLYDQLSYVQRSIVDDLLAKASQSTCHVHHIVDLGCGTGYALDGLSKLYQQAYLSGLDLAPSMLNVASQRLPQVRFAQGDIEALPYASQSFDLTWSSSAIQWCELNVALAEMARVTKQGGTVLLSTFIEGTLRDWRQMWGVERISDHARVEGASVASRFASSEQVRNALNEVGLTEIDVQSKTYEQSFLTFAEAIASVRDLGAGNAEKDRQPGLLSRSRYAQIKKRANQIIEQQGCLTLSYEVLMVVACR